MYNPDLTKKIISKIILAAGFFLMLFSILAIIQNIITLHYTITKGVTGLQGNLSVKDSLLIVMEVDKYSGAYDAGIIQGDTIIKVNGMTPKPELSRSKELWGSPGIGEKVIVRTKKADVIRDLTIIRKKDTFDNMIIDTLYLLVLPFILFCYVSVGLWGLLKNPFSLTIALISLVCFSIGLIMYSPLDLPHAQSFISESLYFFEMKLFMSNLVFFVPAFWIYLFMVFPEKSKFYESKRLATLSLIFFIPVLFISLVIFNGLFKFPSMVWQVVSITGLLYVFFGIVTGIIILHSNSKRITNTFRKRQFRLVLFGIKFGGIAIISGWILLASGLIFRTYFPSYIMLLALLMFLLCQVGGLIIPFTFLNTFYGNKILETEWILKKKIFYISATTLLFLIYLSITYLIVNYLISSMALTDTSIIIIATTLIAVTFYPINKKIQNLLVIKLYPERTKYHKDIEVFSKKLQNVIEINTLLQNLSSWLEQNFHIKPAIAFALSEKKGSDSPFKPVEKNSIVKRINDGSVFFWDEVQTQEEGAFNNFEKDWIIKNNISITIPLISYGECVGLLNIGKKTNNQDFNGSDIEILKDAASQSAFFLQNLRLQSEYIEKKRLDKELNVARIIQSQLLPQVIPQVKGLDLFGKMRPCFEVAGDYFDILPLDDNKTVLALGDVSGKGAGAALLMSNLQAGLRAAFRFTQDLPNIVSEINNIINQNTSPEQFITFFIGVWDAENNSLHYVNAGHNPPLIIKPDGQIIKLDATGFFLGPIPGMQYASEKTFLSKDDILIIYTDGIEETFNSKEEQFGVDNIIRTIRENSSLKSTEIGAALYKNVEDFSEGLPYSDDATVIIAKVTG